MLSLSQVIALGFFGFMIRIDKLKTNLDLYPDNTEQQTYIELCQQAKNLWS